MEDLKKYRFLNIGRRKRIDITIFKGEIYIHFNDMKKDKSFTFHKSELDQLFGMKKKIARRVKKLRKIIKQEKKAEPKSDSSDEEDDDIVEKKKSKKQAKVKKLTKTENIEMSSDEDMEESS